MNDFVNSLLDNQHITKRTRTAKPVVRDQQAVGAKSCKKSSSASRPAFRPRGLTALSQQNSRFIDKIPQNPAKIQRKAVKPREWPVNPPVDEAAAEEHLHQSEAPPRRKNIREAGPQQERSWSSFALSVVSITAIFLIVLGVFFIIHSQDGSLDWTGRDVISLSGDSNVQHSLALYAGINFAEPPTEGLEIVEALPLDLMETFAWQNYRVRRGDTVSSIALAFSVSMDAIIASNGITNARALREGETLRIPNMDGIPHTFRSGDTLVGISQSFGVPLEAILDANDIQSDNISAGTILFIPGARMNRDDLRMALGDRLFVYPVRGARLTSPFGWRNDPFTGVRRHHAAIDLAAPTGTPIMAAKDGRISALGYDRVFGNFIIMTHANGFQTLYAHLHTITVRRGEQVRQGVRIGTVGNTGLSTGPHLHFAIYRNNRAVNPLDFLNPRN